MAQQPGGQQATQDKGTEQVSSDSLTQALQPLMAEMQQHMDKMIRDQMEQARQTLRTGMDELSSQVHSKAEENGSSPEGEPGQPSAANQQNASQAQDQQNH